MKKKLTIVLILTLPFLAYYCAQTDIVDLINETSLELIWDETNWDEANWSKE